MRDSIYRFLTTLGILSFLATIFLFVVNWMCALRGLQPVL